MILLCLLHCHWIRCGRAMCLVASYVFAAVMFDSCACRPTWRSPFCVSFGCQHCFEQMFQGAYSGPLPEPALQLPAICADFQIQ